MKQPVCWIDSDFDKLVGETIVSCETDDNRSVVVLNAESGKSFCMFNGEVGTTLELVDAEDDLNSLIGKKILFCEQTTSSDEDDRTWSFVKIRGFDVDVTLRFVGDSNGYYSEAVEISETAPDYSPSQLIKVLDESDAAPFLNQVKGVYLILGEDDKRRLIELDFNQYDAIKRFLQLN